MVATFPDPTNSQICYQSIVSIIRNLLEIGFSAVQDPKPLAQDSKQLLLCLNIFRLHNLVLLKEDILFNN